MILTSDQLKTAQNIAIAIKGLALVLSLLTFLFFGLAIYLSREGRWVTVLFSGIGLIAAGFAVIVFRKIAGGIVVDQLVMTESAKPAGEAAWSIAHLADDQHRDHGDRHRRPLRVAGWLASPTGSARAPAASMAPVLRDYTAYVYTGLAIVVCLYFLSGADPGPALLPHHAGPRRHGRLRDPRAAQADRGGVPRRRLQRRLRPDPRQGRQRGQGRQHRRARRRAGLEAAPAREAGERRRGSDSRGPDRAVRPTTEDARLERLERLASLRDKGVLTDEEFAAEKSRLLGGSGSTS